MATTTTTETASEAPVWGYEIKDYLNIGTVASPQWVEFDNLTGFDASSDSDTYEPEYINRKTSPKFTLAQNFSVEYTIDLYRNNTLSSYLIEHEDETDIEVELLRVYTWLGTEKAMTAKKALCLLTPNPVDKSNANQPGQLSGTINRKDEDWTKGTWSGTAFTAATAS